MDINSIQKRLTTNTLKWINWFYALIASILIIVLHDLSDFVDYDYQTIYESTKINLVVIILFSIITLAYMLIMNLSIINRTKRRWAIVLSLVLVAISGVFVWLSYLRCVSGAQSFDYFYGDVEKPFQDWYYRIMFICFYPYIITAIVRFVSLSKKYLASFRHTSCENSERDLHYFLFFVIYIGILLTFSSAVIMFILIVLLQILSLLWRKSNGFFWFVNVIHAFFITVLICLDIVVGTQGWVRGGGPVNMWGVVYFVGFFIAMFSYGINVILAIVIIIRRSNNRADDKHLNIRLEQPEDYREVENLTREAFWNVYRPGCQEHYVLNQYRDNPDFIRELDFVMEKDGKIIGHVMFSKAEIILDDGTRFPSWTFGPISIHPDYKRKGCGLKLLNFALEKAKSMGVGLLCMEGNIEFYKHAGFDLASKMKIHYHAEPRDSEAPYFLAQEIIPGYWGDREGTYCPPKGYFVADENPEAFEAYDATFPAKEKLKLPGQLG